MSILAADLVQLSKLPRGALVEHLMRALAATLLDPK